MGSHFRSKGDIDMLSSLAGRYQPRTGGGSLAALAAHMPTRPTVPHLIAG
jgi:hypothetical protein